MEIQATVEDLMYAAVLEKFLSLGIEMMGSMDNITESAENLKNLTEGLHSREALDMVKEHVKNVMGPSAAGYANTLLKMSKLQAAQVRTQGYRCTGVICLGDQGCDYFLLARCGDLVG